MFLSRIPCGYHLSGNTVNEQDDSSYLFLRLSLSLSCVCTSVFGIGRAGRAVRFWNSYNLQVTSLYLYSCSIHACAPLSFLATSVVNHPFSFLAISLLNLWCVALLLNAMGIPISNRLRKLQWT